MSYYKVLSPPHPPPSFLSCFAVSTRPQCPPQNKGPVIIYVGGGGGGGGEKSWGGRPNFFKDKGWAKRKFHYDWGWVIV